MTEKLTIQEAAEQLVAAEAEAHEKNPLLRISRAMLGALNAKRIQSPGNADLGITAFRAPMWQGATEAQRAAADRRHARNRVARASRRINRRRAKR